MVVVKLWYLKLRLWNLLPHRCIYCGRHIWPWQIYASGISAATDKREWYHKECFSRLIEIDAEAPA